MRISLPNRFSLFGAPVLFALAVRGIGSWASHGQSLVDVASFRAWAEIVDEGQNPYTHPSAPANYPPIWVVACWVCLRVSSWTQVSFDLVIKLVVSVFDTVTVLAVARLALALGAKPTQASAAAWVYAANPVAILISAFHAQNDPVVMGLAVWACWLLLARPFHRAPEAAFLLLGISLGIKPVAVLFLPVMLLSVQGMRRRAGCFLLASSIAIVPWIPYLAGRPMLLFKVIDSYRGPPDFGYVGIFNAWENLGRSGKGLPVFKSLPRWHRPFYLGVFLLVCWRLRNAGLLEQILAVILSLYLVYGALGAQYLFWIVPFATAVRSRWVIQCSALSAVALFAFYQLHHSGILTGQFDARLSTGIRIPQWHGLLFIAQSWLYVCWFRWLRALFRETHVDGIPGG